MNHLFKRYVLILLIAVSFQSSAQNTLSDTKVDSLLHVLRFPTLDSLLLIREYTPLSNLWSNSINKNRREIKNATLHQLFQKIENLAAEHKNPGLEMYAGLWKYNIDARIHNSNSHTEFEKIVEKASSSGVLWVEIVAKYSYKSYLIGNAKNSKDLEKGIWILRENIEKILKSDDVNLKVLLNAHFRGLAHYYYDMDDLPNAIRYSFKELHLDFPRGSKLIPPNHRMFKSINNNLGVYYRENHQLDSSTFYFKRVFDFPLTKNSSHADSLSNAIAGGNLGENFYLQGSYKEALPLLQRDAAITFKLKYWGNASNALILLTDI